MMTSHVTSSPKFERREDGVEVETGGRTIIGESWLQSIISAVLYTWRNIISMYSSSLV